MTIYLHLVYLLQQTWEDFADFHFGFRVQANYRTVLEFKYSARAIHRADGISTKEETAPFKLS